MKKSLTPRGMEIARKVAAGRSNRQIADELKLSHRTVEGHRSRMMMKLGISNLSELIHYALRHGLIEP